MIPLGGGARSPEGKPDEGKDRASGAFCQGCRDTVGMVSSCGGLGVAPTLGAMRGRSGFDGCREREGRAERRGPYSATDSNAKAEALVLAFVPRHAAPQYEWPMAKAA